MNWRNLLLDPSHNDVVSGVVVRSECDVNRPDVDLREDIFSPEVIIRSKIRSDPNQPGQMRITGTEAASIYENAQLLPGDLSIGARYSLHKGWRVKTVHLVTPPIVGPTPGTYSSGVEGVLVGMRGTFGEMGLALDPLRCTQPEPSTATERIRTAESTFALRTSAQQILGQAGTKSRVYLGHYDPVSHKYRTS